jgi:Nucleotidyl transferase AbiEii toxin, Type IV TA system
MDAFGTLKMAKSASDPRNALLLDDIYLAFVRSSELGAILIYKGARVLKQMLVTSRYSEDIDATLSSSFIREYGTISEQKARLVELISSALHNHFEGAESVIYTLVSVDLKVRPGRDVPDEWRTFAVFVHVKDAIANEKLVAQVDISVGESLSESAVENVSVDEHDVFVYSLHRIAGEKLRAFLSSLPAYRNKIQQQSMARRAKDLFDLTKILAQRPISDDAFWHSAAKEFQLACAFRRVDCKNLGTFMEDWGVTKYEYEQDERLSDVAFELASNALKEIVSFLLEKEYLPVVNP